jgi:hypothetical protein
MESKTSLSTTKKWMFFGYIEKLWKNEKNIDFGENDALSGTFFLNSSNDGGGKEL